MFYSIAKSGEQKTVNDDNVSYSTFNLTPLEGYRLFAAYPNSNVAGVVENVIAFDAKNNVVVMHYYAASTKTFKPQIVAIFVKTEVFDLL